MAKVDAARLPDSVPLDRGDRQSQTSLRLPHSHAISQVTGWQASLDCDAALASPVLLSGTPPRHTCYRDNTTQAMPTTAFVAERRRRRWVDAPRLPF